MNRSRHQIIFFTAIFAFVTSLNMEFDELESNFNSSISLNESDIEIVVDFNSQPQLTSVKIVCLNVAGESLIGDHIEISTKISTSIALKKLQRMYPKFNISITHKMKNHGCDVTYAAGAAAEEHLQKGPVSFFVGPICNRALNSVAHLASYWNIPICTGAGSSDEFNNEKSFSSLIRISYTTKTTVNLFIKIMEYFNWQHVTVLTDVKHYLSRVTSEGLQEAFNNHPSIRAPNMIDFNHNVMKTNFKELLKDSKLNSRVTIILTTGDVLRKMLIAGFHLGMGNGDFAFISVRWIASQQLTENFEWFIPNDANNEIARKMFESLLLISMANPQSKVFNEFQEEVVNSAKQYGLQMKKSDVSTVTASFHDCLLMYGFALNKTLADGKDATNGLFILDAFRNVSFSGGVLGEIYIDENGDRESDFTLNDFNVATLTMHEVALYSAHTNTLTMFNDTEIKWPNNKPAPVDKPKCGFDGSQCSEQGSNAYIIIVAVFTVISLFGAICIFVYKKFQFEAELSNLWWKVNWDEISFIDNYHKSTSTVASDQCCVLPLNECPDVCQETLKQNAEKNFSKLSSLSTQLKRSNQLIGGRIASGTRIGTFKNIKVAVKILNIESVPVTREMLMELKQIRDLVHENLIRFIGLCIDDPNIALITELCQRGSLQDLLMNDSFHLDWCFRYSIISDIVDGMAFIHNSSINFHGRLKSSNCVIDNHFIVKLTDFGLSSLFSQATNEEGINPRALLYVSPEHLRSKDPLLNGSQKGDVYSFAIVVQEIITRREPFASDPDSAISSRHTLEPDEVLNLVRLSLEPPFRPILPHDSDTPREFIELVTKCWKENPYERPSFYWIKSFLKQLTRSFGSSNLLDNLLRRMEQYTDNLEQMVEEKTAALVDEKKRSDELLYELLPKYVVKQLKNGNSVEPEEFECVTICFTDIKEFTKISAESSPIEVVDLLNDVYTCFDEIIGNYDVYKVETIGDAYMVVSGLPVRNGNKHGREIARMSLSLLERIKTFKIKHCPEKKLMLRIGVHSGPCAAGVVGSRMPRYCLFGDTVNTASRMESYGEAMKIHISEETKEILDQFNSFRIAPRGEIDIKGKGLMNTYWLMSEYK